MMEARKLQDSALTNLGEQVAVEKGAANTSHATEKLRAQRERWIWQPRRCITSLRAFAWTP